MNEKMFLCSIRSRSRSRYGTKGHVHAPRTKLSLYYLLKKEMISPKKKSKRQKSKNEDPDKLDQEREQRKSIQRQL